MNRNQVDQAKGKVKEVAGKVTGDKSTEHEGKAEEQGGKADTVLADINEDAKKKSNP